MDITLVKRNGAKVIATVAAASLLLGASTAAFADSSSNSQGEQNNTTSGKIFDTQLLGSNEVPAVSTSTSGYSGVWFGQDGAGMNYWLDVYNGDEITGAHLHCAPAGSNGPVVVSLYDNSGGTDINGRLAEGDVQDDDIASTGSNCSDTIGYDIEDLDDLSRAIEENKIYVNVHSEQYPNGTARGQLAFKENTYDNGTSTDDNDGKDKDWEDKNWDRNNDNRWGDKNRDWDKDNEWKWKKDWDKNDEKSWNWKDNENNNDREEWDESWKSEYNQNDKWDWNNNKSWDDEDEKDWSNDTEEDWGDNSYHPVRSISGLKLRVSGEW